MRVLVIGSGGREHALAWALKRSPLVEQLFVAPGNAGTARIAVNVPIKADDISGLFDFARKAKIDLVVPGPEAPLVQGVADVMREAEIPCFGPDAWCAQIEGSKSFAKHIMAKANVPTAKSRTFSSPAEAKAWLRETGTPAVIKADGLAAGKGVIVVETLDEALDAIDKISGLGNAGQSILIEEKLTGEEVSLLCLCDGKTARPLPSAQDHKAAWDGDLGPNTGGMGACCPAPALPDSELERMADLVVRPVLAEMARMGHPFTGVLYAGLMLAPDGPKVLEYNARFGDPECQAILPRLQSDLASILLAAAKGCLDTAKLDFSPQSCVSVVLAAKGYPGNYQKGAPITGIGQAEAAHGTQVFYSGAEMDDQGTLRSSGGRVLCATALGDDLAKARENAYAAIGCIKMPDAHYRKDIGEKSLARLKTQGKMS